VTKNPFALGLVVIGLLGLVACGTGGSDGAAPSHGASRPASAVPAAAISSSASAAPTPSTGCGPFPPRRAWIDDVNSAGKVAWQLRLPTDPTQQGIALQPLVIGGVAVIAEENAVYGLRLSDGRQLWKRVFPQVGNGGLGFWSGLAYGLWQYRGSVIVLVGQASSASRLFSLNAVTGAVRWYLPLGKQGETGTLTLTGDGGLAMTYGFATLTVVDLTTGKIRWGRAAGNSAGPLAVGGVVIDPADAEHGPSGRFLGFSSKTGKLLWTRTGLPSQPEPQLASGLVLLTNANHVIALSPATGRTRWTVTTAGRINSASSGSAGIAVSTESPSRLYLIDPTTGRVRWHIDYQNLQAPSLQTATDLFYEGDGLIDLRAANGSVRWAAPTPTASFGQMLRVGPYAVVIGNAIKPDSPSLVTAYRLATGKQAWTTKVPTFVEVPAAVAGANLLVQSGDISNGCPA
jgi:outer membrane protein assembly factor BamB